jgi:hypothetical protein
MVNLVFMIMIGGLRTPAASFKTSLPSKIFKTLMCLNIAKTKIHCL